jgi:hypothetical protein
LALCRPGYTFPYTSDPRGSASATCQYISQCIAMLHQMVQEEADFFLTEGDRLGGTCCHRPAQLMIFHHEYSRRHIRHPLNI